MSLAADEGWNYLVVPEEQDLAGISSLSEDSAILAPWDICSLGDERVDGVSDELTAVKEVI